MKNDLALKSTLNFRDPSLISKNFYEELGIKSKENLMGNDKEKFA